MRFEDTLAGWEDQIVQVQSNSSLMTFLNAISKEKIQIVRVKKDIEFSYDASSMCHLNVREFVAKHGGQAVYGWILRPFQINDNAEFDGIFNAAFHCNWLSPEGTLWSVSPEENDYQMFLPDLNRKYNFITDESYNNRTVYLNEYKAPAACLNPSRNVNYFTAGQYATRDRYFEKYRIPKSLEEISMAVPASMTRKSFGRLNLTPEGREWVCLKFSVKM